MRAVRVCRSLARTLAPAAPESSLSASDCPADAAALAAMPLRCCTIQRAPQWHCGVCGRRLAYCDGRLRANEEGLRAPFVARAQRKRRTAGDIEWPRWTWCETVRRCAAQRGSEQRKTPCHACLRNQCQLQTKIKDTVSVRYQSPGPWQLVPDLMEAGKETRKSAPSQTSANGRRGVSGRLAQATTG